MSEDFTNVLVRMSLDLKGRLQKEAFVHHRKLTQEINMRLEASLLVDVTLPRSINDASPAPTSPYSHPNTPTVATTNDHGPAGAISDTDRAMLEVFRKLPVEKQLALLSLFR